MPFLLGSVPFAAVGGIQSLSRGTYYVAMGVVLLIAASYLVWHAVGARPIMEEGVVRVRKIPAVLMGCVIGFLSGLIGVGGGIFLSPVLLILGWAGPKTTAGISAPFILVNSAVALVAGSLTVQKLPGELPLLAGAALAGAFVGTWLGLQRLRQKTARHARRRHVAGRREAVSYGLTLAAPPPISGPCASPRVCASARRIP